MATYSRATPYLHMPLEPLGDNTESIANDFQRYLSYHLGRYPGCPPVYLYQALAYTLRDRLTVDWRATWAAEPSPSLVAGCEREKRKNF